MFRFANPGYFWMFLGLLAVLFIISRIYAFKTKKVKAEMGERLFPFLTKSLSVSKRRWKNVFLLLALLFFTLALMRPQTSESQVQVKAEGVELFILVDVSESMLAEDVKPNRLEQAKLELAKLIDQMPGNKTGVIAFAGSAALLSPLTNDPNAVKMYIDSLTTQSVSEQGTNFEDALRIAEDGFAKGGLGEGVNATRVVLIVSDGEDHEPGALEKAKQLAEKGIRIFTMAYGTEKGGTIPQRDSLGYFKDNKKDKSGAPVITSVKGDELKKLADAGRGSFYYAVFGGDHIKNIAEDFSKLEKAEFDTEMAIDYDEQFQIYLLLGFIFALLELIAGERRSQFLLWRGRYEVPPT